MFRAMLGALVVAIALPTAFAHAAGDKGGGTLKISDKLTNDDPADAKLKTSKHKVHEYKMKAGQTVVIRVESTDFDTYLRVEDSAKKELAYNDDDPAGGTLNSKLVFTAPKDDAYRLIVTAYDRKIGNYTLTVDPASEKQVQINKLTDEFQKTSNELGQKYQLAKNEAEKDQIFDQFFEAMVDYAAKFNTLAEANASDPAGAEAAKMCKDLLSGASRAKSPGVAPKLRELMTKAKSKEVQGQAGVALGSNLIQQYEKAYQKKDKAAAAKLADEAEATLKQVKTQLGDVVGKQADEMIDQLQHRSVGKIAKDIAGEDVEGKKFKLSDYKGKVVVLYFWGSWCGPCRAMIPHEKKLAARLEKARFAMVGINTDSDRSKAKKFLEDEGITWKQVWDDGSTRGPISTAWNVHSFPTIYVLDANGVIRFREVRGEAMDQAVDELLKELPGGGTEP